MAEQRPMTYDGADVAEFLDLVDPSVIAPERIVRSIRQASRGVPAAHYLVLKFIRDWLFLRQRRDSNELDDLVHEWWDDESEAEDLMALALEQAEAYREQAFNERLSDNHPHVVEGFAREREELAADLEALARRPRRDLLSELEAQDREPKWPRRIVYEQKHGARNARLFVGQRPHQIISSNDVAYTFRDGVWTDTSDSALAAEVRATDPTDVLDVVHVNNLVKGVHALSQTEAKPFEWINPTGNEPDPRDLALFRNGLLDLTKERLIPHDGRYFATGVPDYDWDPFAECPTWERWLDETLDPAFHPTLQEWFGYCLVPDVRAHKFAVFLGGPRTGKSTAHSILHALVGAQHAASIMMPDLGEQFGMENLLDKRLAVVPDAHDGGQNRAAALERIKSITGADPVSVNRKYRGAVATTLMARLLVTCNKMPKFIDESGALGARMLIIKFSNSFLDKEDRTLGERLTSELSGIANWALRGLMRLRENRLQFTVSEAGRQEVELATRSQSPALRFAQALLDVTGDHTDFTPIKEIQNSYESWVLEEGLPRAERRGQNELAHDLTAAIPGLKYTQRRVGGKKPWGLAGVARARSPEEFDDEP